MGTLPDKINTNDIEVLKCFFTKNKIPTLIEKWRSINWINENCSTNEWSNRTERRLKKLEEFSLIQSREKSYNSKPQLLWYPTIIGLYYMLTTIEKTDQIKNFIIANRNIGHFNLIRKNFQRKGMKRIEILIEEIKECIRKLKYKKIRKIIQEYFEEIEPYYVDLKIDIEPNSRSRKYNHKTKEYELF